MLLLDEEEVEPLAAASHPTLCISGCSSKPWTKSIEIWEEAERDEACSMQVARGSYFSSLKL